MYRVHKSSSMDSYITNADLEYLIQLGEIAVTIPTGPRSYDVRNYLINNIVGKFIIECKKCNPDDMDEYVDEPFILLNSTSSIELLTEVGNNPAKLLAILKSWRSIKAIVTKVTEVIKESVTPMTEPIKTVNSVQLESRVLTNISRMIRIIDSREDNIPYNLIQIIT